MSLESLEYYGLIMFDQFLFNAFMQGCEERVFKLSHIFLEFCWLLSYCFIVTPSGTNTVICFVYVALFTKQN